MNETNTAETVQPSSPVVKGLVTVLAVALTCGAIAWATYLFLLFGLLFYTQQYLAGMLAVGREIVWLVGVTS